MSQNVGCFCPTRAHAMALTTSLSVALPSTALANAIEKKKKTNAVIRQLYFNHRCLVGKKNSILFSSNNGGARDSCLTNALTDYNK